MKIRINRIFKDKQARKRAITTTVALLLLFGLATVAVLAAANIAFVSPFTDATHYANIMPARFTFPDSTSDSNREFVPQINWVLPTQNADNGKNAIPMSVCSFKLQNYLNTYQVPNRNNQFILYNATKQDFVGWKMTGTGQYTLWPTSLNPSSTTDRFDAYDKWLSNIEYFSQMKSSAQSWYNDKKYIVNLHYPDRYQNNGAGPPYSSGYALDAYFLPPDLRVKELWTMELSGGKMQANAIFENTFWADVKTNVYLYAVVNGVMRELDSRIGVTLRSKFASPNNVWQLQAEYPAGTTKLVACVGVPWNGMSWQSSVDNDSTTTATVPELNLTLRGKKIELGSDLYRPETKQLLANNWNNNYKEFNDPEQPGAPPGQPEEPNDIAANMIMPIDPVTQQPQAYVTPSSKIKIKLWYISGFPESGTATVRLYSEDKETYQKTLVSEKSITVTKGQSDVIFDNEIQLPEGLYRYIATINYRWNPGWVGEKFNGKDEATYDNNKVETDIRCTIGGPPTGVGYWPPVVTKKVKRVEKVPVWGWKRVEYDVEEAKIKTRLVE